MQTVVCDERAETQQPSGISSFGSYRQSHKSHVGLTLKAHNNYMMMIYVRNRHWVAWEYPLVIQLIFHHLPWESLHSFPCVSLSCPTLNERAVREHFMNITGCLLTKYSLETRHNRLASRERELSLKCPIVQILIHCNLHSTQKCSEIILSPETKANFKDELPVCDQTGADKDKKYKNKHKHKHTLIEKHCRDDNSSGEVLVSHWELNPVFYMQSITVDHSLFQSQAHPPVLCLREKVDSNGWGLASESMRQLVNKPQQTKEVSKQNAPEFDIPAWKPTTAGKLFVPITMTMGTVMHTLVNTSKQSETQSYVGAHTNTRKHTHFPNQNIVWHRRINLWFSRRHGES